MDKLSQFLVETFQPSAPIAARPQMQFVEPTAIEKRAYSMASMSLGQDTDFLEKFEGTPLAPQAIALAEQELAMQQQQLQKRMQRTAERKMDDTYDQDCIQEDGLRLQKQQLLLQLYKMKAMTPPQQPGDAVIGAPDPAAAAAPQLGAEIGGGAEGGAPVQEPTVVSKLGGLLDDAAREGWSQRVAPNKNFARDVPPAAVKQAAVYDTKSLLKKYPGMELGDDAPHTELLELGGHPGLPIEARQAILQKYLEHRSAAPLMTPEASMQQERSRRGGVGGALGMLGGLGVGTLGGTLLGGHYGGEGGAQLGMLAGMMAGGVGGGMLGHGIGSATASQHTADSNIAAAKAHQAALAPLLADPVARERILHELTARHYQNQIRALNQRGEAGDYDDVDFDDTGAKKASIQKFAAAIRKRASFVTPEALNALEQQLVSAGKHVKPPAPPVSAVVGHLPGGGLLQRTRTPFTEGGRQARDLTRRALEGAERGAAPQMAVR